MRAPVITNIVNDLMRTDEMKTVSYAIKGDESTNQSGEATIDIFCDEIKSRLTNILLDFRKSMDETPPG